MDRGESKQDLVEPSNVRILPTPVTVSGVSAVSTVWLVTTFLLTAGLIVAAGYPYWLTNENPPIALSSSTRVSRAELGMYYFCYNLTTNDSFRSCVPYLQFESSPANHSSLEEAVSRDIAFLLSSSVIYGFGCGMQAVSLIIGIVAYCKPRIGKTSVFLAAFIIQMIAAISLVLALVLFPVSLGSNFVQQLCGQEAGYYYRGFCSLNWSLFTAMVLTACSLYLPSLAIFSMNISDGLRGNICF